MFSATVPGLDLTLVDRMTCVVDFMQRKWIVFRWNFVGKYLNNLLCAVPRHSAFQKSHISSQWVFMNPRIYHISSSFHRVAITRGRG